MRRCIVLVLAVGFLFAADKPKKDGGKDGATPLEGTWVVVSVTVDGKEVDRGKGGKFIFEGKTVMFNDPKADHKGTITIDPKKMTIDIKPDDKDKPMKGLYQLKGDELKMCFARPGKDRPKDLTSEEGQDQALVVLKRAKSD
jgi:uncharacterized protein (TIGR03067 family)